MCCDTGVYHDSLVDSDLGYYCYIIGTGAHLAILSLTPCILVFQS